MADEKRISESRATYELLAADLSKPVVIERDGRPFGVFLAYEEYERLKAAAQENALRQERTWQQIDTLLADVHTRPAALSSEQIEAEISAATQEAREERRARSSRH